MGSTRSGEAVATDLARLPVTTLKNVGPRLAERLARLDVETVEDLLFHLPLRYQDRTRITPIGTLRPGDQAVIEAELQLAEVKFGRRRMLLARVSDGSGSLTLRFFHFNKSQQAGLARGTRLRCFGEVRRGATTLEMIHPEYRAIDPNQPTPVEEHLTPIYPVTEGVQQPGIRRLVGEAMKLLASPHHTIPERLPPGLLEQGDLTLAEALQLLHAPPPDTPIELLADGEHPAQQRLIIEELLAHHLSLRQLRHQSRRHHAPPLPTGGGLCDRFTAALPFTLTGAQRRVGEQIADDLAGDLPMQRLVQGDVGSGKTVVAALAALQAIDAGYQAAVMAPTELLAEQHYQNFRGWLEPLGIEVAWLSGRQKAAERREQLEAVGSGRAQLIVGTHALFQAEVLFARLALVVIDEQHRFGVHQRLALREKGVDGQSHPHQLIMTATPIPRTLAMTAYADLDVSVIDELPPGRTPVETVVIPDSRRPEVIQRIEQACRGGRQAYWVCALIEESESLQCQAAEESAAELDEALPGLTVALLHGRMKGEEKEAVMAAFKEGTTDLLVATTVIEVGVDVPNASLMVIENAERFGLAQLHQLRGRVGRGSEKSSCVLMFRAPLSETAKSRLAIMRESSDGFVIAQRDLELRGPGELLGTRQTGLMRLRVADLERDSALLPRLNPLADRLLTEFPEYATPLVRRWLGNNTVYSDV